MTGEMGRELSVMDVAMKVKEISRDEELLVLLLIAWGFWLRINKLVNDKIHIEPRQVTDHALSLSKMFTDIKSVPISQTKSYCCWKPPSTGFLKLNVDGVMFSDLHRVSVGVVLRDDKGDIVIAASKMENEVVDPEDIELLAIFKDLEPCANLVIQKLIIKSDCLLVTQVLQNAATSLSMLGNLMIETRKLLSLFGEYKFSMLVG